MSNETLRPLGMWEYFAWEIIFSIPVVGLIFLIVFSLGGTKNVNLRNFARSYFCFLIIIVVFSIFALFGFGFGDLLWGLSNN